VLLEDRKPSFARSAHVLGVNCDDSFITPHLPYIYLLDKSPALELTYVAQTDFSEGPYENDAHNCPSFVAPGWSTL